MTRFPPKLPGAYDAPAGGWIEEVFRTRWLLVGLFVLMLVGAILTFYQGLPLYVCRVSPDDYCNGTLVTIAHLLAPWELFVVFGACLVVSLVLLRRGRRAFYVPLLGALTMVVFWLLAFFLFLLGIH